MTDSDAGRKPPPPPAYTPPPRVAASGLSIAALVVGIGAFLIGWIPFAGAVIGIVGIVLGSMAVRTARGRGFAITGLVLSVIATITSVLMVFVVLVWIPAIDRNNAGAFTSEPDDDPTTPLVDTSCYSFDLPARYGGDEYAVESWNEEASDCIAQVEVWGPDDGDVGVGVTVTPYTASTAEMVSEDGTLDDVADFVEQNGMARRGTLVADREPLDLAGAQAILSRYDRTSTAATDVMIVAAAPADYAPTGEPYALFIVRVSAHGEYGDELLATILDTWRWK